MTSSVTAVQSCTELLNRKSYVAQCRFKEDALPPWTAISTSVGIFVIAFLVGHMLHASRNRIDKVEENCRLFKDLKTRADDAVIAKSQVLHSKNVCGSRGFYMSAIEEHRDATSADLLSASRSK